MDVVVRRVRGIDGEARAMNGPRNVRLDKALHRINRDTETVADDGLDLGDQLAMARANLKHSVAMTQVGQRESAVVVSIKEGTSRLVHADLAAKRLDEV